jgi:hypothetical protein
MRISIAQPPGMKSTLRLIVILPPNAFAGITQNLAVFYQFYETFPRYRRVREVTAPLPAGLFPDAA